ncbi:MAG: hypothetical protein JO301_00055 [Chitinophagaceae bacterium]|nr:hypothetical protein [Chitinophagaceae bacterium]
MYITDNTGRQIKVTDLDAALAQAELFAQYFHEDKAFSDFDELQKSYWLDIIAKLKELKSA